MKSGKNLMKILKLSLFIFLIIIISNIQAFSLSATVKTHNDYNFTLDMLRNMHTMIENFGDEDLRQKYDYIKNLFQEASENYYGQNYDASYEKFRKLKSELIIILEKIAQLYLNRTREILDSTSKDSFNILIEYSKKSGLAKFFIRSFDPLKDIKPYKEEDYHYFHDRERIESYLNEGYKRYHAAYRDYTDPEIEVTKKRKNLPSESLNLLINRYYHVIQLCRESKQYSIEIYKLKNVNELGKSIVKYNIKGGYLDPIYDDRIPEKYKPDANDNLRLIHSVEKRKLGIGK
jgi:hypothetical protein